MAGTLDVLGDRTNKNRIGSPETPISRLAVFKTPFRRMAFPGDITRNS